MSSLIQQQQCPCGTGEAYDACCGRLHRGAAQAATPEELMRSRYSAYAVGDLDYVWRTWHPRTRPTHVIDPKLTWTRLEILDAADDVVEFVARHHQAGHPETNVGALHETSRFARRAGRWFYLEAVSSSEST